MDLEKDDDWYFCVCDCHAPRSLLPRLSEALLVHNSQSLCSHLSRGQCKRFWHLCSLQNEEKHLVFLPPLIVFTISLFLSTFRWMCSDIVSRLPNEVSNYEPCYFLHIAGCDRGKEGTQREEKGGREGYRGNSGLDSDSGSPNKKREKENSGVSKHSLQMQPWNNISATARTIICPSKPAA